MQHYGSIEQEGQSSEDFFAGSARRDHERIQRMSELQSLKEKHSQSTTLFEIKDFGMEWCGDSSNGNTDTLGILSNASNLSSNSDNNFNHHDHMVYKWMDWQPKYVVARRLVWVLLVAFILIPIILCLHRSGGSSIYTYHHSSNDSLVHDEAYDYIVVGGGPAGILVATELARKLGNSFQILLLEAGTISQSSVMENVYRKQMEDLSSATEGKSAKSWSMSAFSSFPQLVNQMDIPILWSGVASKASSSSDQSSTATPVSDDFHHWHVPNTLLAKALGGCGVHNAMLYVRALRTDFEKWNMTGWSSDRLLQYYQDLESFVDHHPEVDSGRRDFGSETNRNSQRRSQRMAPTTTTSATFQRGANGPIRTHPSGPILDTVGELFRQSCAHIPSIGLALSQGFNHPDPSARIGAGIYEFNIRNGVRDSVAKAFLGDHHSDTQRSKLDESSSISGIPKNLDILLGASVTRVLTTAPRKRSHASSTPQAVGVEFLDENGHLHKVLLKHKSPLSEVILSCGAIMTPQVLHNSGIGENGSVANLPGVGKNLQDHPVIPVLFRLASNMTEENGSTFLLGQQWQSYLDAVQRLKMYDDASNMDQPIRKELLQQLGTMGTAGFSTGAFLRSPWAKTEAPDVQVTVFPRAVEPHVVDKAPQSEQSHTMSSSTMLVTIALLDADARYEVKPSRHRSTTRIDQDHQQFNFVPASGVGLPSIVLPQDSQDYFSAMDVRRLQWGIEQVRRVQQTPPLLYHTQEEVLPGIDTDLEKYIRSSHLPNSHWTGSTKMGHGDDPLAVVDESLKVRNIKGLRIVDAGVMPTIPNGNTHSAVTVVASRAVDLIRNELQ